MRAARADQRADRALRGEVGLADRVGRRRLARDAPLAAGLEALAQQRARRARAASQASASSSSGSSLTACTVCEPCRVRSHSVPAARRHPAAGAASASSQSRVASARRPARGGPLAPTIADAQRGPEVGARSPRGSSGPRPARMPRGVGLLAAITPDLTALRRSRDFRVLEIGAIVAGLGTQAALVAIPFQVYVQTHSTALVGLIGAAELGPMVVVSLLRRRDRRPRRPPPAAAGRAGRRPRSCAGTLAALAFTGRPPVWAIFVLAALLAGSGSLDSLSRSSMIAGLAGEWLRSAIAFNFGMSSVTAIVGPGLGGTPDRRRRRALGLRDRRRERPRHGLRRAHDRAAAPARRARGRSRSSRRWRAGCATSRSNQALLGSFVIDLVRHDLRDAASAVRGALAARLPCRRRRQRPALRVGLGRRHRRRARQRLAGARPPPGPHHDRDGADLGRGDRRGRAWPRASRWPPCCSRSRAPPTRSAPSAARRSPSSSPPRRCAGG